MHSSAEWVIKGLFWIYRMVLSPSLHFLGGAGAGCRFEPTCSRYCEHAIATHGGLRGLALSFWRVMRCHPWGGQGWDPVPPVLKQGENQ